MRLIDADALVATYDAAHDGPPGKAKTLILNAPTVDAVEVVRCKDCANRGLVYCQRENPEDWEYCSDGKRRN